MSRPTPAPGPRLLKTKQAAGYLNISERALWTMTNCREITSVRFGAGHRQSVRYDVADLDAWVDAHKKGGKR